MNRRRVGLALLAGGAASFAGISYLAARALSARLISSEGLGPTAARREDLIDALRAAGASVGDFRHSGSDRDPVELAAVFASPGAPAGRATLLFLHGKGGNSGEWRPDALRAIAQGYNVLVPDLRAHPPSGGRFISYGFLEKEDLANMVAAARARFGLDERRLAVHACSAGVSSALEYAAGRVEVRALWLESPFADPFEMAQHYIAAATGLPPWALRLTTRWAVQRALAQIRRELGVPRDAGGTDSIDPARSLAEVRGRVCLVYGENDLLTPPRFAERLQASLPEGGEVWRAAGAGHCHHDDEAAQVVKAEYERRWTAFFRESLLPA